MADVGAYVRFVLVFLPGALVVAVIGAALIEWLVEKALALLLWICDHMVVRNLPRPRLRRRRRDATE